MNLGKQFLSYIIGPNDDGVVGNSEFQFNPRKAVVLKIFMANEKPVFQVAQDWNKKDFEVRSFYKEEGVKYTTIKDRLERLSTVTFNVIVVALLLKPSEDSEEDPKKKLFESELDSLLLKLEELGLKSDLLTVAVADEFKSKFNKILSVFNFKRLVLSNPNKFTAQDISDLNIGPNVIELRCGWLTFLPENITFLNRFKRVSFVLETFDSLDSFVVKLLRDINENRDTRGSLETIRFLRNQTNRIESIPGFQKVSMDGCWQSVFRLKNDGSLVGIAGGADYYTIHFLPPNTSGDKFTKYREEYRRANDW